MTGPDADRIAELERRIARFENDLAWHSNDIDAQDSLTVLHAELARLRNEQPKGDDAALTQWRREPTCFYDGRTRPISNNADEWQVFLEHWLDVRDGRVHGTSFVCVQIAEAIDAAEKCGCVFASFAPSPAPQDVRGSESSAWGAFWISEAARGHKYEDAQAGFRAGWKAALAQSDAEPMRGALNHIARLTKQRDALIHVLQRCQTVLHNMAMENEGALFNRWPIHHEPLRSDAKHLLPLIEATLDAIPEPDTAPPRPDAPGLIEAVELFLGERIREFPDSRAVDDDLVALAGVLAGDTDGKCLAFFRTRAADRSAPLSDKGGP